MALFAKLLEDYLLPARLTETPLSVLKASEVPKTTALELSDFYATNPAYFNFLIRMDLLREKVANWTAELERSSELDEILLKRTAGILGKNAMRNVAVSIGQNRLAGLLPKKASDKYFLSPPDQLRFALMAEEYCQTANQPYSEKAFLAGLHYDWMVALIALRKAPKDAKTYLEQIWKDSMRNAQVSFALGAQLKNFEHDHELFGAALIVKLGKVLMSILFPREMAANSWNQYVTDVDKRKANKKLAAFLLESRRFPITHTALSALFASFFGPFRNVERAIQCQREPYLLKGHSKKGLYRLALLLWLGEELADSSKISKAHLAAIQEVGLSEATATKALASVKGK